MLVHMSVRYEDIISHFGLSVCFWQINKFVIFCVLFDFLLFEKMDQRNCNKFCIQNETICARTFEMLCLTFGESTMSRTQVQLWYNQFKEDQEDVNDDARHDRLITSTTGESVKKMILNNRRITISEVAGNVGISFNSCQAIFTDVLGIKRAATSLFQKCSILSKNNFASILLRRCWRRSTTIQICSKRSLVTNHGCMAMTLKPKPNHPSGSAQKS